ncbi:hypothetical protein tb265_05280 [Gemmatimonadetes bacterium T265]|nr:hypothetical protein tb265_05280 [Gemmatimonadetes bacterium T265]
MTALRRALLLAGWALLVLAPVAGALFLAPAVDSAAVAYGSAPPSRALAALEGAVPGGVVAAVLFLVVTGRVRRSGAPLAGADRSLVAASELAGWALGAVGAVVVLGAMVFGGPPGIIGGFATAIVVFSLLGRGRRRRGG